MLWVVLVMTGLATAIPAALVVRLVVLGIIGLPGFHGIQRGALVGLTAIVVGGLDTALLFWNRPRPWSMRSQVPRLWGHESGPWLAATRYGLRLGLGPATILNSWMWWGATFAAASLPGGWLRPHAMAACMMFVVARSTLTVLMSSGVHTGTQMATRMRVVSSYEQKVRVTVAALASVAGFIVVIRGLR